MRFAHLPRAMTWSLAALALLGAVSDVREGVVP